MIVWGGLLFFKEFFDGIDIRERCNQVFQRVQSLKGLFTLQFSRFPLKLATLSFFASQIVGKLSENLTNFLDSKELYDFEVKSVKIS